MAEVKVIEVVGGIIFRDGKYLLGKRPTGKSLGGHWEFIGGKIELGETPEQALARECVEEIALPVINERVRTSVTHAYPDRTIHLTLIDCEPAPGAEPKALEHDAIGWFLPEEMETLDFCPADRELLPVLFPEGGKVRAACHFRQDATDSLVEAGLVDGVIALPCTAHRRPLHTQLKWIEIAKCDNGWKVFRWLNPRLCFMLVPAFERSDAALIEEGLELAKNYGLWRLAVTHILGTDAQVEVDAVGRWLHAHENSSRVSDVYFVDKCEGDFNRCKAPDGMTGEN